MKKKALVLAVFFLLGICPVVQAEETAVIKNTDQQSIAKQTQEESIEVQTQQEIVPTQQEPVQVQTQETAQIKEQPKQKEEPKKSRYHPYIRTDIGFTYTAFDIKYQGETAQFTGFQGMFNLAAGVKKERTRFELEYQSRATVSDVLFLIAGATASVENNAVMANAFYDFVSYKYFALYIGGGAGVNMWTNNYKNIITHVVTTDKGTSLTGGIYLGASINIPIGFSIDFGVDYLYISEPQMNSFVPKIGVRITF
ncbi:MAG: hypothetical protein PHR82_04520 [Endomicrobiaceae bacterium]|nr:hypothetical protein [Endomicrobiaceae bacterium]